jgi:lysyl-tRNA synthetase class 2
VRDVFIKRSRVIRSIRELLDGEGFIEVETPVLQTIPGGAAARPFVTRHNSLGIDMYLRIALELYLKRLIVGGLDRVYEIGRVFRNEGMSHKHNPEYTLLELYQAYTDYYGMMDITERIFRKAAMDVTGSTVVTYQKSVLDFGKPFERLSMADAVMNHTGIDFRTLSFDEAVRLAAERKLKVEKRYGKGDILNLFFDEYVERHLIQPTFIMNHPVEITPLAKMMPEDPAYTLRFEIFIAGKELGNAYSEINDPIDQRSRFEYQESLRAAGDDEANMIDEDFLQALETGMPPTGGLGIGIDRLVMLLTNNASIRDVLLFPTMKPV